MATVALGERVVVTQVHWLMGLIAQLACRARDTGPVVGIRRRHPALPAGVPAGLFTAPTLVVEVAGVVVTLPRMGPVAVAAGPGCSAMAAMADMGTARL